MWLLKPPFAVLSDRRWSKTHGAVETYSNFPYTCDALAQLGLKQLHWHFHYSRSAHSTSVFNWWYTKCLTVWSSWPFKATTLKSKTVDKQVSSPPLFPLRVFLHHTAQELTEVVDMLEESERSAVKYLLSAAPHLTSHCAVSFMALVYSCMYSYWISSLYLFLSPVLCFVH